MSILPQVDIDIGIMAQKNVGQDINNLKEYAWDFKTQSFIIKDGKFQIVEGVEALKIWIWKVLLVPKKRYKIYSEEYGQEFESIIGKWKDKELLESECKRYLWECLKINPYILGLENFLIDTNKDKLTVSFTVETKAEKIDLLDVPIEI